MIFDTTNLFSNAQAVTGSAASTNIIDLGDTGRVLGASVDLRRDIGKGKPISIDVRVVETFADADANPTLTVALQVDDDSGFGSAKTVWTSGAIAEATLVAGYVLPIDYVPSGTDGRYARLYYTVSTGAYDAGKITAGIVAGKQSNA